MSRNCPCSLAWYLILVAIGLAMVRMTSEAILADAMLQSEKSGTCGLQPPAALDA
jgi:hypothetical protein